MGQSGAMLQEIEKPTASEPQIDCPGSVVGVSGQWQAPTAGLLLVQVLISNRWIERDMFGRPVVV